MQDVVIKRLTMTTSYAFSKAIRLLKAGGIQNLLAGDHDQVFGTVSVHSTLQRRRFFQNSS